MKIKLFSYLGSGMFFCVLLFAKSYAMEKPQEVNYFEDSVWCKVGLAVKKTLQERYYKLEKDNNNFSAQFGKDEKHYFDEIKMGKKWSVVLVTTTLSENFKPTIVKAYFHGIAKYLIDCTRMEEVFKNKLRRKTNGVEYLLQNKREELARCKAENEKLSVENAELKKQYNVEDTGKEQLLPEKSNNQDLEKKQRKIEKLKNRLHVEIKEKFEGLEEVYKSGAEKLDKDNKILQRQKRFQESRLAILESVNKSLSESNLQGSTIRVARTGQPSKAPHQIKNQCILEKYPKTSLLIGCAASLSIGLWWPSIKYGLLKLIPKSLS